MDDKELIKRVKNSFKAKKSQAEILQGFQKRGYKLAYADKLITKAKRPKRIAIALAITLVVFFSLTFSAYTIFSNNQKRQLSNPLAGFTITGNIIASAVQTSQKLENQSQETTYEEIEITPDFISFLLNEIGAWQLHKNPITFQNPVINFQIDDENFHSEIDSEITTFIGLSDSADLQFNTNKKNIIDAIMSDNPEQTLKKSIAAGKTQIQTKATQPELFAKGYFKLYESLNN